MPQNATINAIADHLEGLGMRVQRFGSHVWCNDILLVVYFNLTEYGIKVCLPEKPLWLDLREPDMLDRLVEALYEL